MYPAEMMEQLSHSIRTQRIGFLDRVVLLQDEFALALAGYRSFVDVFILLQAYTDETNFHVWSAIDEVVTEMDRYLSYATKRSYNKFQEYILEIYSRAEERFGFKAFNKSMREVYEIWTLIYGFSKECLLSLGYPPVHEFFRFLRHYCECLRQQSRDQNEGESHCTGKIEHLTEFQ